MIMIKIVRTKTWNKLQEDLRDVQAANIHLHELLKGHYNKYQVELGEKEDHIKALYVQIGDLEKKLRKAEHEKAEAIKMMNKKA